jgi:hypothetical protein
MMDAPHAISMKQITTAGDHNLANRETGCPLLMFQEYKYMIFIDFTTASS